MQNTPHQAQKTIFTKFDQFGMGLGMFWWSNGVKLKNLSLMLDLATIWILHSTAAQLDTI